ncbi:ShlB/FhaC/HecB family hemolysin secretion/activation protein [Pollutimonas bauzanensis]|uniref:Hemolysin activation/secretion protein n=1 Tax=Pollutimonas bauzanensis TaxID=658167 RepID=A0A1M5VZL4_9BURK|nr:ShlB/FhaC/HecB family hemolysin secretion/activation protein [Pollutimonas bauzanensis]SHH80651.1 Hemolysin activation/secretion protein [Pollutimonas bauzanensis]
MSHTSIPTRSEPAAFCALPIPLPALRKLRAALAVALALAMPALSAQTLPAQLPSGAEPGRAAPRPVMPQSSPATPEVTVPSGTATQAPAGADKLDFTLTAVDIEGATRYTPEDLRPLYDSLLGKTITVADAFKIANDIELRYRGEGYVTTRIIVPEQTIEGGRFRIIVIEGYISEVVYDGDIGPARQAVEKLVSRLRGMRPVSVSQIERQLLLANDLPGLTVRASLEPSPKETGGSVLVVRSQRKAIDASLGFDNRNSPYLGSHELLATVSVNSLGAHADRLTLTGRGSTPFSRSKTASANYDMLVSDSGMTLGLGMAYANSVPGRELRDLDVDSDVTAYTATLTYPLIRSRLENLRAVGQFEARDVSTDIIQTAFTRDRLRVLRFGLSYDRSDSWNGITALRGTVHKGLNALGASSNGSEYASRVNGRSDFLKFTAELTRLQQISEKVSLVASLAGQYSANPLLASEEFSLGGGNFGRGYDYGEMSADNGIAASLELRYAPSLPKILPYGSHFYGFVDGGRIWSRSASAEISRSSLSSFGGGMRANLAKHLFATLEIAKPVSPAVYTKGDKHPRIFFSIAAQY